VSNAALAIIAVFLLTAGVLAFAVVRAVSQWRRYREPRVVVCPETGHVAAVRVDSGCAALTAFTESRPVVRLEACTRWPARAHCEEPCISQIVADAPAPTLGDVAQRWYHGKSCAYCGHPIAGPGTSGHPAALVGPDQITVEWPSAVPDDQGFTSYLPVCWNCHVAETFRRVHPELVVDRSARKPV
jgi:hypothetical protein